MKDTSPANSQFSQSRRYCVTPAGERENSFFYVDFQEQYQYIRLQNRLGRPPDEVCVHRKCMQMCTYTFSYPHKRGSMCAGFTFKEEGRKHFLPLRIFLDEKKYVGGVPTLYGTRCNSQTLARLNLPHHFITQRYTRRVKPLFILLMSIFCKYSTSAETAVSVHERQKRSFCRSVLAFA